MGLAGLGGVLLYRRRVPGVIPTNGMGARIGALAGLFGFAVFVVFMALQMLVLHGTGQLRQLMQQVLQQAASQNADPRAQQVLQRLASPQGLALMLTLVLVLAFFAFLLLSSLGGALGAYLLRKQQRGPQP
jgi:heme exporter protein D